LTALDRHEFDAYTSGRAAVSAIGLRAVQKFPMPQSLAALRRSMGHFYPPQFMTFLDNARLDAMAGHSLSAHRIAAE
jgi:predicted transcriptional regulator